LGLKLGLEGIDNTSTLTILSISRGDNGLSCFLFEFVVKLILSSLITPENYYFEWMKF